MSEESHTAVADETSPLPSAPRFFFASRWRGEATLATAFWRDMMLVGSLLNGLMTLASIALLGTKFSTALALLLFLAPVPLNVFLFVAVWRSAERSPGPAGAAAKLAAALWLAAASLL